MPKRAVLYIRVSTDRQAEQGFSLPAQKEKLIAHCNREKIEVAEVFVDDFSAKDGFDRPGYNQLRKFIGNNKQTKIDYLFVTQWSRFSRFLPATFEEYNHLKSIGIVVDAIEQHLDFSIPENLIMASIYFAIPQVENERLSLRVKAGMRQAMKQGNFVSNPPKGYKRENGRIVIDESNTEIIKWAFNQYAKGIYSAEELRTEAQKRGLKLSKQGFLSMLGNIFYTGKILIKATKDEPQEIVDGLHAPLIDEHTYKVVQDILHGKRKPYKMPQNEIADSLPLRGHLICPHCGRLLTGSIANNGHGGRFAYYHCQLHKYNCNFRTNATATHEHFENYLRALQPREEIIELYEEVLADVFNDNDKERLNRKKEIEDKIQNMDVRIAKIMDEFTDGNIDSKTFNELKARTENQKNELVMQHVTFTKRPPDFDKYVSYSLGLMKDLSSYYQTATPTTKNKLVGLIFPEKLIFTGKEYQTTKLNDVFGLICNAGKGFKENSLTYNVKLSTKALPVGLEPTTL